MLDSGELTLCDTRSSLSLRCISCAWSRTTDRSHKVMAGHHDEHPGNHYNMCSCHCNTQYHHYCHWHSPLTSFTQINSGPTDLALCFALCVPLYCMLRQPIILRMRVPRAPDRRRDRHRCKSVRWSVCGDDCSWFAIES